LSQIRALDADLLCLQEVDNARQWNDELHRLGYCCLYTQRPSLSDGVLLCFRASRFCLRKRVDVDLDAHCCSGDERAHADQSDPYRRRNVGLVAVLDEITPAAAATAATATACIASPLSEHSYDPAQDRCTYCAKETAARRPLAETSDVESEESKAVDSEETNDVESEEEPAYTREEEQEGDNDVPGCPLPLVVATTHLFWDPAFGFVKQAQARAMLTVIQDVCERIAKPMGMCASALPVVFAGDFNTMPDTAVYQLLTGQLVSSPVASHGLHSKQPHHCSSYAPVTEEEIAKHSDPLSLSFRLRSAYAACGGEPAFTNYTPTFSATIDYVLVSEHFQVNGSWCMCV
jgi:mRNA deadenylase 3'-5' endonuclease subunit Ccr4